MRPKLKLWLSLGTLTIEGHQPVVQQSTACPSGSRALRSQTWLRKIDARNCVEWAITEYLKATSCVDFAKDIKWRASTSSAIIHSSPYRLRSFAKPDMASQNRRKKLRRFIQLSKQPTQLLALFCEATSGFAKLLSQNGKLWIVALLVGALQFDVCPPSLPQYSLGTIERFLIY